jgi:hypothetical protein
VVTSFPNSFYNFDMAKSEDKKTASIDDVVGIEIGSAQTRIVRVKKIKGTGKPLVLAVGEATPIVVPGHGEEELEPPLLRLPKVFGAPYAAFAVTDSLAVARLVSLRKPPEEDQEAALSELFGTKPPENYRAGYCRIISERPGEFLYMASGLPEVVGPYVAGILPDDRPPAPHSLQATAVARLNTFQQGPVLKNDSTGIIHVEVEESTSTVTEYNNGRLVAYRQFPVGSLTVVSQVAQQFGLSNTLAEELLNENQIDPSSATDPILVPLFRNVAMSVELVTRREGFRVTKAFLSNVTAGADRWLTTAESTMTLGTEYWMPFDDFQRSPRAFPRSLAGKENLFVAALGAALAVMGDANG